ncbi:MAG: hypothetical protein QOD80_1519, partial [Verrucomicrobiota bacterium]
MGFGAERSTFSEIAHGTVIFCSRRPVGGVSAASVAKHIPALSTAKRLQELPKRAPDICENIARQKRLFAFPFFEDRDLGSAAATPRANSRRVVERKSLPDQSGANTRKHVAHSARRHPG